VQAFCATDLSQKETRGIILAATQQYDSDLGSGLAGGTPVDICVQQPMCAVKTYQAEVQLCLVSASLYYSFLLCSFWLRLYVTLTLGFL